MSRVQLVEEEVPCQPWGPVRVSPFLDHPARVAGLSDCENLDHAGDYLSREGNVECLSHIYICTELTHGLRPPASLRDEIVPRPVTE